MPGTVRTAPINRVFNLHPILKLLKKSHWTMGLYTKLAEMADSFKALQQVIVKWPTKKSLAPLVEM